MNDSQGLWIPTLSPKGYEAFNDYHRFLILAGCRKSTKTISAVNKIARHLWENDGAIVGIIGKTLRNVKSSGVWQDLTTAKCGIPQWIEAGIGFKYVDMPKMTGDTKMTYFRVRNVHGGTSECQVHSLEHEHEVETKFKGGRWSMIYLPEADQFKNRMTFDILEDQLRVIDIPQEQHQLIADCNPPKEGEDHFLHELFYRQVDPDGTPYKEDWAKKFRHIDFQLDDNPFMSDDEKESLKSKYRHDKNKYARFVLGLWQKDESIGHFAEFFIENIHVRGNASNPDPAKWQIIVPTKSCLEVLVGWDPGDVNHAASFIAPRDLGDKSAFDVIDEVVILDEKVSLSKFSALVEARMDFWEDMVKELYDKDKIKWSHRADFSVMKFKSSADMNDALIIQQASNNRILMRGIPKLRYSVEKRVSICKRLLFENRLFVSAQCRHHIEMFRNIKRGRTESIDSKSPFKHVFDAMTYPLLEECPEDLIRRKEPEERANVVSVNI